MSSEIWLPIKDWPNHQVSNLGRVKGSTKVLNLHLQDGYPKVTLVDGPRTKTFRVQRLVCEAFHGPAPFIGAEVLHKNHVRHDVSATNLYWGSHQANCDDRQRAGNTAKPGAKLDWDKVREIRRLVAAGTRAKEVAQAFGISQPNCSAIINNRTWVE